MPFMDDIDRSLLNRIQSNFPTSPRPFQAIAEDIGITETDVIQRVRKLKADGIIRRIGGNFSPEKVGFVSTLCAAKVPEEEIETFSQVVNGFNGVTHNYKRDSDFNIWFTFIAPSMEKIKDSLSEISRATGINNILNLPATHVFKIKAKFKL